VDESAQYTGICRIQAASGFVHKNKRRAGVLALRGLGSGFEAGEDGENDVTQGVKGKPERTQQVVGRQDAPGGQAVGLPEPLRRGN